ncbi:MAG: hypothetical protein PHS41_00430 [Victivallaceae bacterium]|nr:hypothetical protein [Victivallaceae bacterium]
MKRRSLLIESAGRLLALAITAAGLSGCVQLDYNGQTFAPVPESETVELVNSVKAVPPGYTLIGYATMEAGDGIDIYEIREHFQEKAREVGATLVAIEYVRRVKVGEFTPPGAGSNRINDVTDSLGTTAGGAPIRITAAGTVENISSRKTNLFVIRAKALFYVRTTVFDAEMVRTAADRRDTVESRKENPSAEALIAKPVESKK